jgi:hypothetical protein
MLNLRADSYGKKLTGLCGGDWFVQIVLAPVIQEGVVQLILPTSSRKSNP